MAALKLISHKLCPYVQRAVIALHVAAAHPDQVRSVIALAPYDRVSTPFDGYLTRRDYPGGPLARALGGM